jgi:hypothetical protein
LPSQNFRVKNGLEVGTGVTISAGIITATTFSGAVNASTITATSYGNINSTTLNVSGVSTFGSSVYFGDGDVAYFGDGQDLLIFHNSTDSVIRDNGTGDLYIEGGNRIKMTSPTGIETYAVFNQDGAAELWYDDVKKFETIGSGTTTTGTSFTNQLNVSGVSTFFAAGIGTVVIGVGTTALLVQGNARITGILTIGQSSLTLDGNNNQINVGAGVTIHHINGVQVGGNTVHSTGLTVNQISVSGISTLSNVSEKINNLGNTGTSATIDLNNGNFVTAILSGSCTFTFTNPASEASSFTLLLTNDGTSDRTITWPASVVWPGGTIPNRTTAANKTDIYVFFTVNSGTKWYGNLAQYNYA